jgi:hypothetical protein
LTDNYPCLGGHGAVSTKRRWDTLCRNCVFASGVICGSYRSFWCVWGTKHRCTIFHAQVGLAQFPHKACRDTLRRTSVFASGAIYGSRTSFLCIWDVKHQHTIFILGWPWYRYQKKRIGTHSDEYVFLHPMRYVGPVVNSSASGAQNIDALFLMLGWDRYKFHKKDAETRYVELVFCIRWDLRAMYCILVCPGCETLTHYFSCSGGPGADTKKKHWDTLC